MGPCSTRSPSSARAHGARPSPRWRPHRCPRCCGPGAPRWPRVIDRLHENPDYLPGVVLPDGLRATASLDDAVAERALVIMAVPSHGFRTVLTELSGSIAAPAPVLSLAKGLEQGTHLRMTEVIAQVVPGHLAGVLTGPNLAREIAAGQPAATVVAMADESMARQVQEVLRTSTFRVYTNPDVVGCEMAGATKNVLAIAAGILQGLGLGDSSLAALITRGLAELDGSAWRWGASASPSRAWRAWGTWWRRAPAR